MRTFARIFLPAAAAAIDKLRGHEAPNTMHGLHHSACGRKTLRPSTEAAHGRCLRFIIAYMHGHGSGKPRMPLRCCHDFSSKSTFRATVCAPRACRTCRFAMQNRPFRHPKRPVWVGETACPASQHCRWQPAARRL